MIPDILGLTISKEASLEVAKRSRGTPRIANRLLKRVADFGLVLGDGNITNVVDWSDSARNYYKENKTSNLLNPDFWFKEHSCNP